MPLQTKTFAELIDYSRDSGATRVNQAGLIVGVDFSTTSVTFGTGLQTFTLAADLGVNRDWPVGSRVRATSQAAPLGLMNGVVESYNPATQELVINVETSTGTGSSTNWRIGSLEFRQDFDPVTLAPRGGLVEGQATNALVNSLLAGAVAGSPGTAPTGWVLPLFGGSMATTASQKYPGANRITLSAVAGQRHFIQPSGVGSVSGTTYCFSAVVSIAASRQLQSVFAAQNIVPSLYYVNGVEAVPTTLLQSGTDVLVEFVYTAISNINVPRIGAGVLSNLAEDTSISFEAVQWEVGYRRSSYIPTTTTAVTRAADLLAVDGQNFSDAYNPAQGTIVAEVIPSESSVSSVAVSINDGSVSNAIRLGVKQSGTRSSIRAIASDGVTDVMGLNATGNNLVRSNGVDYDELNTGIAATMFGVANNGAQFLAAGGAGAFASGDGTTFVQRSIERDTLTGAHFGIGRFVIGALATDGIGSVRVSTDGLSFRRINIAGLTQNLNEVTSNGVDQYVAVGNGGVIYTSPDAETWTAQTSGTAAPLSGVHWFGGRYVAVGNSGNGRYSDDGVTWNTATGLLVSVAYQDVSHNGTNLWVSVGSGGAIYSSADGITWTSRTSGVSAFLYGIHFADGLWVAVGASGTVVTSPDGITWTDRTATSGTTAVLQEVGFFGGKFYYVGLGQLVGENTAANIVANVTWTSRTASVIGTLNSIATNGTRLLICGSGGAIATSDDGVTFTSRTGNSAQLNGAAFGNGTYVVVGSAANGSGLIATVDPVTFSYTRRVSNTTLSLNKVRQHRGNFYASGNVSRMIRSVAGDTWNELIIGGTAFNVQDTADSGGLIVAVGSGGRFSTSVDGLTWTTSALTGATTQQLNGADFANGLFVAVGNAGTIITSPNGTAWTLRTSGTTANLFAVHYSTRDQQWYAAGDNGTILRSADAITWESIANDAQGVITRFGATQANPVLPDLIPGQVNRLALRYGPNGMGVSVNSGEPVNVPAGSLPVVTRLNIGADADFSKPLSGHVRRVRYFPFPKDNLTTDN